MQPLLRPHLPAGALSLHEGDFGRPRARRSEKMRTSPGPHPMSAKIFPTAQDAENAFYEALERCDLEAMMAVWSEDDDIVCVHPAGQRLAGQEQVREVWRQMFSSGPNMRVQIAQQVVIA